jgi:hypothetical protein
MRRSARLADSAVCAYAADFAVVKLTARRAQNLHRDENCNYYDFLMVVMMRGLNFHREQPKHQHAEDGILRHRLMIIAPDFE